MNTSTSRRRVDVLGGVLREFMAANLEDELEWEHDYWPWYPLNPVSQRP